MKLNKNTKFVALLSFDNMNLVHLFCQHKTLPKGKDFHGLKPVLLRLRADYILALSCVSRIMEAAWFLYIIRYHRVLIRNAVSSFAAIKCGHQEIGFLDAHIFCSCSSFLKCSRSRIRILCIAGTPYTVKAAGAVRSTQTFPLPAESKNPAKAAGYRSPYRDTRPSASLFARRTNRKPGDSPPCSHILRKSVKNSQYTVSAPIPLAV